MKACGILVARCAVCVLLWSAAAGAQPVVTGTEHVESDRPEAWAVKYFTSTTLLSGFGAPRPVDTGSILLGGELVWIPFLTTEQQRVGFRGTKLEDLNKAPFFARPRITIGLPADFAATVAFVPPVETFGVTPKLFALALERPLYTSESWTTGWRVYGQVGTAESAFTCPENVLAFPAGSIVNPTGCLEASSDVATLRYVGLELGVGDLTAGRRIRAHAAAAVNYLDNAFAVNARRFDFHGGSERIEFIDRTVQRSEGVTFSVRSGVGLRLSDRLEAAVDVFYTPLWVRRQDGSPLDHDGLVNAKALLRYRLR